MNTAATIEPLMVAMMSATVIASGTARCTRLAATVMPVNTSSAAPIIMYLRTLFLTSAGSECMPRSPNNSRSAWRRTLRQAPVADLTVCAYNKYNTGNKKIHTRSTKCQYSPVYSMRLVNCSGDVFAILAPGPMK